MAVNENLKEIKKTCHGMFYLCIDWCKPLSAPLKCHTFTIMSITIPVSTRCSYVEYHMSNMNLNQLYPRQIFH